MAADTLTVIRPQHLWIPERAGTFGPLMVEVAELAGLKPDPEQALTYDAIGSYAEGGKWAALEAADIAPRQNKKTFDFKVVSLYDLFVAPLAEMRLSVWTAHLFDTAQEAFRDLDEILAGTSWFARKVKRVSRAHGKEGFELKDGRRIRFRARSDTGGRGLTGDRVILDEAFALKAGELGSLLPTLSARPNPQVLYGSSAGMVISSHLRSVRDRGRAGGDPSLVWVEYCARPGDCARPECDHRPGAPGCVYDDETRWREANPAVGRRISIEYLRQERRALPPNEWARERLGWWEDPVAGDTGISPELWEACANRDAETPDPVILGLDVAPGHVSAAITVHSGGVTHLTAHHAGTSWILGDDENTGRLTEIADAHQVLAVVIDPTGPVGGMIPDLERAGFTIRNTSNPTGKLVLLDGRDQTRACEQFLAGVLDGTFVHRDEYALNVAVSGAGRRVVGDSWKWSRRDSTVDISPLVAATVGSFFASKPPVTEVVIEGDLMA